MVKEIDLRDFSPGVQKPEFGNPEHIALSKGCTRYLEFETKRSPLRMKISDSIGREIYLNPFAVFCLVKELELGNANIEVRFLATLNCGMGWVKEGGLWDEETEGIRNFEMTLGLSGPAMKEYEVNNFERSLAYSVNHTFFHETQHIREALLGLTNQERFKSLKERMLASKEDREKAHALEQTLPPEIFARKKMSEVLSGRKELLPLVIL